MTEIFKVVVCGNLGVGKTCILYRLMENKFVEEYVSTIGSHFVKKEYKEYNIVKQLNIWDTTGDEKYSNMIPMFFKGSDCVIIVFDVTDRKSFNDVDKWIEKIREIFDSNYPIIIVGAKCDLENVVSEEEAKQYARKHNLDLFYSSSKTGENINEIFEHIANILTHPTTIIENDSHTTINKSDENETLLNHEKKRKKCPCCCFL